jgi:hypothetical protein
MRGSWGIPEIGDILRSSRTLDTSLTRVANQLVSTTRSTSASRRSPQSSMSSISLSRLSYGLSPRA